MNIKRIILIIALFVGFTGEVAAQLSRPYFYTRGREFIIEGRYGEAIESLNLLLRSQDEEYEGYFLRGVAKYNLGDLVGAAADFTLAIEFNPVYTLAFQYRGITNSRLGKYSAALKDFERAIEMRPNFSGAYYSRAVTSFLNQQFHSAVEDYNSFLRLEPSSAEGYVNRGTAQLYLKDTTSAMNDYNRAIAINPYFEDGYLRRGVLYLVKGETKKGITDMDKALSIDSTAAIGYFYRAMGLTTDGKIMAALDDFDSAVKYDPTNSVAIFNRALLRSQIGDYNRAIDDYGLVAQQNPNNVLVYYNRAAVYAQLGDYPNAIADYTRAIEIYGDFANAYLYRSQLKAALRDKKGYEADRRKAQELMSKYRDELAVSGDKAFADTSARFSNMISFNADFEDDNLSRLNSKTLTKYKPKAMFKLELVAGVVADSIIGYDYRKFYDDKVKSVIDSYKNEDLRVSNSGTNLMGWRLMELDTLYSKGSSRAELFNSAVVKASMKEYSDAMAIYSFMINDDPNDPLPFLNRAVTEAQMTEFASALEGDYQSVSSRNDPAGRLNATSGAKTYDFSRIISDLTRASELLPEMPYIFYNLGYMHTLMGNYPAAIENYSRALEIYPYFAEAYYNRGLVQLTLDEKEKGALDLSRAGEIGLEDAYQIINSITKKQ